MALIRTLFYLSVVLCIFYNAFCAKQGGDRKQSKTKTVYVLLQSINGKDNDYLSVNDTNPLTGTAMITVKKPFKMEYEIYFYYPGNNKLMYSYKVCDLLKEKGAKSKSKLPNGLFPREMIKHIFVDQDDCEFQVGKKDITVDGGMPFIPEQQAGFSFPSKDKFDMNINVVSENGKNDPKKNYIFSTLWKVAVSAKNDSNIG